MRFLRFADSRYCELDFADAKTILRTETLRVILADFARMRTIFAILFSLLLFISPRGIRFLPFVGSVGMGIAITEGMIKHTPGPWYQYSCHSGNHDANSQMVCTDGRPRRIIGQRSEPFIVVQTSCYSSASHDEAVANASLIAAAPELLETLREVLSSFETALDSLNYTTRERNRDPQIIKVRAAIAKAEGSAS